MFEKSAFKPISKKTVVEIIVEQIKFAILSGELKPGDKIPTEFEFVEQLSVGRNSVREAIKMLSGLGILEIRRGDGTYIVEDVKSSVFDSLVYSLIMEQSSNAELIELRRTLEIDVMELAMNKIKASDIKHLRTINENLNNFIRNNRFSDAAKEDLNFHFAITDITNNKMLIRIVKNVLELFHFSIIKTLKAHDTSETYLHNEHELIIEVLEKKDTERIEQVIDQSLLIWKNIKFGENNN